MRSSVGDPASTLVVVRKELEELISEWIDQSKKGNINAINNVNHEALRWRWSPLFETEPLGGPKGQNRFINAVLVVDGERLQSLKPSKQDALILLQRFLTLEKKYGRDREQESIKWGPRTIDIDFLAWGGLQVQNETLTIPHPRLIERNFVIVPLAAAITTKENTPKEIIHLGWPESKE